MRIIWWGWFSFLRIHLRKFTKYHIVIAEADHLLPVFLSIASFTQMSRKRWGIPMAEIVHTWNRITQKLCMLNFHVWCRSFSAHFLVLFFVLFFCKGKTIKSYWSEYIMNYCTIPNSDVMGDENKQQTVHLDSVRGHTLRLNMMTTIIGWFWRYNFIVSCNRLKIHILLKLKIYIDSNKSTSP